MRASTAAVTWRQRLAGEMMDAARNEGNTSRSAKRRTRWPRPTRPSPTSATNAAQGMSPCRTGVSRRSGELRQGTNRLRPGLLRSLLAPATTAQSHGRARSVGRERRPICLLSRPGRGRRQSGALGRDSRKNRNKGWHMSIDFPIERTQYWHHCPHRRRQDDDDRAHSLLFGPHSPHG